MNKIVLTGMTPDEITALLPKGKEKYRGMQIFRWIHEKGVTSFEEMTNLNKAFREELNEKFSVSTLQLVETKISSDESTDKFLWKLSDGKLIESVIIRDEERTTACVSSQVGCRMGCAFCRTAEMGFKRNLTSGEIISQLIQMRKMLLAKEEDVENIVFMGMGEPLDNLENVIGALKIINSDLGLAIGQRKITISTCGLTDKMPKLAEHYKRIGLAISLNSVDDQIRSRLMPVNKKYPISAILEEARRFVKATKRRVTFEYILLEGMNDSQEDARKLLAFARKVPCKINLISYNEYSGCTFGASTPKMTDTFQRILFDGGVTAFLRKSKGSDILAACGQLAVKGQETRGKKA